MEGTHWSTWRDQDFLFTNGTYKICPRLVFWPLQTPLSFNKVGCLDDIVRAVNLSATANVAQLVGTQDGSTVVPMYEWSTYFDSYTIKTALKGITKMHHFRFSRSDPGKVFVKNRWSDKNERCINLLRQPWNPTGRDLPNLIIPKGLSLERRVYLHDKIREFCPEHVQDLVCPNPLEVS